MSIDCEFGGGGRGKKAERANLAKIWRVHLVFYHHHARRPPRSVRHALALDEDNASNAVLKAEINNPGSSTHRLKNDHGSGLLQTQNISSSALHPTSGITYLRRKDCLLVTLFDGSIHTVHKVSTTPALVDSDLEGEPACSENLSKATRSVFTKIEQGVDRKTMNRINGLASYDGGSTFIWAQEYVLHCKSLTNY